VANILVYLEKDITVIPKITIHAYKAVTTTSTWIIMQDETYLTVKKHAFCIKKVRYSFSFNKSF